MDLDINSNAAVVMEQEKLLKTFNKRFLSKRTHTIRAF